MKKKVSLGLILALVLALVSMGALAAALYPRTVEQFSETVGPEFGARLSNGDIADLNSRHGDGWVDCTVTDVIWEGGVLYGTVVMEPAAEANVILLPEEIEYADRRFSAECRRTAAFGAAYLYFWNLRRKKEIILCKTEGLEHLAGVKGAVITCNHFHPMDSFIMQKVFDASGHPKRMYRVIREGNYTSFPGFYGFLMRNCNTLPLSSNMQTMKKFLRAVDQVLSEGNCLLIYPEQSMWWNYRKPKPLKPGAFDMALKNHVPVVPCFITMADSDLVGGDGFPVQEYTPHLGAPIWPDETLSRPAAREQLRQKTEDFCRETYETVYGIPLRYETRES